MDSTDRPTSTDRPGSPGRSPFAWLRYLPKIVAGLALTTVAAVTGRVSYIHIFNLTLSLHQPETVARLMPFGVDGLIVVGSVVLLQPPPGQRYLGWTGIGPGVLISLFANVESGIAYGWLAAGWAGVPALAFFLATFMLERWLTAQAAGFVARPVYPEPEPVYPAEPGRPAPDEPLDHLVSWLTSGSNGEPGVPERHREARAAFAAELTRGELPGIRAIRRELSCGQDKATEVQAYLRTLVPGTEASADV